MKQSHDSRDRSAASTCRKTLTELHAGSRRWGLFKQIPPILPNSNEGKAPAIIPLFTLFFFTGNQSQIAGGGYP